jgi:hypothetical protein
MDPRAMRQCLLGQWTLGHCEVGLTIEQLPDACVRVWQT